MHQTQSGKIKVDTPAFLPENNCPRKANLRDYILQPKLTPKPTILKPGERPYIGSWDKEDKAMQQSVSIAYQVKSPEKCDSPVIKDKHFPSVESLDEEDRKLLNKKTKKQIDQRNNRKTFEAHKQLDVVMAQLRCMAIDERELDEDQRELDMRFGKVGVLLAQLRVYAKDEKEPDVMEYDVDLPQRQTETFKGYNRHMEYRKSIISQTQSSERSRDSIKGKVSFVNSSARNQKNYATFDTLSIQSIPQKAHSVKNRRGSRLEQGEITPDTDDYSSGSVDGNVYQQVHSEEEQEVIEDVEGNQSDEISWDAREIKRLKKIRKRRKQKAKLRLTWDVAVPYVQEMITRLTINNKQCKEQNYLRNKNEKKRKSAPMQINERRVFIPDSRQQEETKQPKRKSALPGVTKEKRHSKLQAYDPSVMREQTKIFVPTQVLKHFQRQSTGLTGETLMTLQSVSEMPEGEEGDQFFMQQQMDAVQKRLGLRKNTGMKKSRFDKSLFDSSGEEEEE